MDITNKRKNPAMSWNDFNLHPQLLSALEHISIDTPTAVQEQAIPALLKGGDWQITAHTGSGKTLAYLLPALHKLLTTEPQDNPYRQPYPRLLVLSPTRELASQIFSVCRKMIEGSPLYVTLITGGEDFGKQKARLKKNPAIVIATPGRMREHLEKESTSLERLEMLVLDEADKILDMGFRGDVEQMAAAASPERQSIMLSATLYQKALGKMRDGLLNDPGSIVVNTVRERHESIEHKIVLVDDLEHRSAVLAALLKQHDYSKALIFTNTRGHAERLAGLLQAEGIRAALLHGEIPHEERKRVFALFRSGRVDALVATDVAARGLDIRGIDLVINFDMPRSGDDYAHRSGRTGRAGEAGLTLSLVGAKEWNLMLSIQRYLGLRFGKASVSGLEAKFSGPKKQKKSGKAVGRNKKSKKSKQREKELRKQPKVKKRLRDRKNIGKRRKPSIQGVTKKEQSGEVEGDSG